MMARLFGSSKRIDQLERDLSVITAAFTDLTEIITRETDRGAAAAAAIASLGARVSELSEQAAEQARSISRMGEDLGRLTERLPDMAHESERIRAELAALSEQLRDSEQIGERHGAALEEMRFSLHRLDRQNQEQAEEAQKVAMALFERIETRRDANNGR